MLGYSTTQLLIPGELFGPGNPSQLTTGIFRSGSTTQLPVPVAHCLITHATGLRGGRN